MAIENISQDIADLLATKDYDVKYTDGQGQDSSPEEAKTFAFDWVAGSGKNYGTAVIVIGDDNDLQLFFGDNLGKTMENPQDKLNWFGSERETGFLPELKNFAAQHRYTFSPKDINQLKHTMQGMAAIKEGLFEGYYGTRKVSYVGEQTEARLVIKHNRMIGEDDKRYRYVESLFIETAEGERFKLPFVKLSGGRAMLEHVKQGGRPYDIRGQHINEIVTEMAVLSRFNRASQQRVFEGITQELVETVQHYYSELRESLQHMATGRGYNQYFESWTPADIGDETALVEDLKTMFIEQTLDARIEAALPTLAKIQQRGNAMKEAQIFENWANGIMEGTWALPDNPQAQAKLDELMSKELIVGPDATNATEQLYDVIGDDQLFDILNDLAEQDPRANIWDDTDVQARLQELGIQMNTTPAADQQQPVAPAAGQQAPGTAPEQAVAEGSNQEKVEVRFSAKEYAAMSPAQKAAKQEEWQQLKQQAKMRMQNFTLIDTDKEQGVAEESSENKYSNLSNRGVNRGINRAADDFDRMMDLDQVQSPHYKTQHQQDTKQRLKTKPMAGPKGVLPEQGVAEGQLEEANIQPTGAMSRSHIGNLSNPVTNSVVHPSSGKEIGLITQQPTGEYYAHPSSTALANSQGGTFATKDEAHQFIRNAHAKAIKNGTLSDKWQKKQPLPQFAKGQQAPGTAPEQGMAEAAKWRDPKYKDRLYTQEPGDSDEYDDIGYGYDFPERPENDPGQKRRMGGVGSKYDRTDPLVKGFGRHGVGEPVSKGPRKGLPSRDQITSLKQSIRDISGKHPRPNLPEQGMAEDQLDELSPATLSSYARKAKGQAGWAAGVATAAPGYKDQLTRGGEVVRQQHIVPGSEADQYDKLAKRRYAGARQAVGKGANVNPGNVEPYDWAKQGGYGDTTNPAMRKRGMAENTELATMLKYAGVPVNESRIHENSEYTYEKVAKILARENPGLATDRNSKEFYSAVYHELIAIGMTPKAARNLISYDEDFMSDVASAYDHYQTNPGLDESNSGMIMPEADPIATVEAMPELSAPVLEGTCNATMEGEYCPEHGLAECGMYEMGTVAGGMAPVIGEAPQDPINYNAAITGAYYESKSDTALLARIKSLALLR